MKRLFIGLSLLGLSFTLQASESKLPKWIQGDAHTVGKFAQCGTKKYCKQMQSCAEAYYFLETCRLRRLDRDKDGVPCESICGKRGQHR